MRRLHLLDEIHLAENWLRDIDPVFARGSGPFVLCALSPFIRPLAALVDHTSPGCVACTNSVFDVLAGEPLRRRRTGRAFAMWFGRRSANVLPEAVCHEAAHFIADESPARDEVDENIAVTMWWGSMNNTGHNHDSRWIRAAVHVAHRLAAVANEPIDFGTLLGSFVADPVAVVDSLKGELQRTLEPLESILASPPPTAFANELQVIQGTGLGSFRPIDGGTYVLAPADG